MISKFIRLKPVYKRKYSGIVCVCFVVIAAFVFIHTLRTGVSRYAPAETGHMTEPSMTKVESGAIDSYVVEPDMNTYASTYTEKGHDESVVATEVVKDSESRSAAVDFSTVVGINEFLLKSIYEPNASLRPFIETVIQDRALLAEWLNWLSTANQNEIRGAANLLLAAIPQDTFVDFASIALLSGSQDVVFTTMSAFAMRNDIDIVDSNLVDPLVNLVVDVGTDRFSKAQAIALLSDRVDVFGPEMKAHVSEVIRLELHNGDQSIQTAAVNGLLKLNQQDDNTENIVMSGITYVDIRTRAKTLERLDFQLENGLQLSTEAVAAIHYEVLNDIHNGVSELEDIEAERYKGLATYILGELDLTPGQIAEMQAAGLGRVRLK